MKYVRVILMLLFMLCGAAVLVVTPTEAHAQSARFSSNSDCVSGGSFSCTATWELSGVSVHGVGSDFTIDNPHIGSGEFFEKYVAAYTNGSGYELAGITTACTAGQLWYYYENDATGGHCIKQVPSQDVNTTITVKVSYYASNGGGGFATILSRAGSQCNPCSYPDSNLTNFFTKTDRVAILTSNAFTGHRIWGGEWVNNRYFVTSWNYEQDAGVIGISSVHKDDGSIYLLCTTGGFASDPPPHQMCFNTLPSGNSTGGVLYSCVYDSLDNTCTLGS